MTLIKMSKRTLRNQKCGHSDAHYWAKDTTTDKFYLIDANATTRSINVGAPVPSSSISECHRGTKPASDSSAPAAPESIPADTPAASSPVQAVVQAVESKKEAPVSAAIPDDKAAALAALLATLSGPSVDPETVRQIVKDEINNVVFPTTTVVVRESTEERVEIEGAHPALAKVIAALSVGEHVLMVGPAGTGKSHIAAQAAEALNKPFSSMSVGPQTSKSEITGYMDANGNYVPNGQFRGAFEKGGLHLWDEIDRGHGGVMTIMNAALANGHMAFPDRMVTKSNDFLCCAAANTYGRGPDRKFVGAQQLDDATLDRFTIITVDYDESLENKLCQATGLESAKVAQILKYARHLRKNAAAHVMPVTVGMRATVGACRLLLAGWTWQEVVNGRFRRGLSDADWSKLSANAPAVAL